MQHFFSWRKPELQAGDQVSAEDQRHIIEALAKENTGQGPCIADRTGAAYAQRPVDAIELYEVTSAMLLSEETSCSDPDGEWLQFYCKGKPVRENPSLEAYKTDSDSREERLWLPTAFFARQPSGALHAVGHPSYAVGQTVLTCQTYAHRIIISPPHDVWRFRLLEPLLPCDRALAVLIDEDCDPATVCKGGRDSGGASGGYEFYVYDRIDIFDKLTVEFAPTGHTGYAKWMPDAVEFEVLSIGGPCCEESSVSESSVSESSVSESSVSESSAPSESESAPSESESSVSASECIECFEGLCIDDLEENTAPDYVIGIKDGCLYKFPTTDCEESSS